MVEIQVMMTGQGNIFLSRSRGREEQCSYNKFGLEDQGLSRFGGSGGVEDQY